VWLVALVHISGIKQSQQQQGVGISLQNWMSDWSHYPSIIILLNHYLQGMGFNNVLVCVKWKQIQAQRAPQPTTHHPNNKTVKHFWPIFVDSELIIICAPGVLQPNQGTKKVSGCIIILDHGARVFLLGSWCSWTKPRHQSVRVYHVGTWSKRMIPLFGRRDFWCCAAAIFGLRVSPWFHCFET
jgi:hypothetical protein